MKTIGQLSNEMHRYDAIFVQSILSNVAVVSYGKNILKVCVDRDTAYLFVCDECGKTVEKPDDFYTYYVHNIEGYQIYCV
jgi:hypothetical protein